MKNIRLSPQDKENTFNGLKDALKDKIAFHNEAVKALEERIAVIQKRLDTAYLDKIDGKITEDFWRYQTDKWMKEKEDLALKLLAHQKTDTHYLKNAEIVMELAEKAYDLFMKQDSGEKRKLINLVFSKSSFNGKTLHFTLRKPFDTILECQKNGKWGG